MIGAKPLHPHIAESYYYSFFSKSISAESRRLAAQTLIPGNHSPELAWQYPTRSILSAQWNDTYEQGFETARVLYSLEPTITHYLGQSVLKLTGASVSEIKKLREGGELPAFGFSIDVGLVDENTLPEYGFRKTPKKFIPSGVDPNQAFLDFQVSLPVVAGASLDISGDGKVEINQSFTDRSDFVAYSGRVSLEHDPELYARVRHTEIGNLALGNGRSFGIVYELLRSTEGQVYEGFQDMFARNEVSPTQPLINLNSLAS